MKFPTTTEMAKDVAEKALHEYEYKGKTVQEWIDEIIAFDNKTSDKDVPDTNIGKWIPCSERLPELFKSVLVTVKTQGGNACYVSERFVINGEEGWSALCGRKPIAWMPLPEPYKGE